MNTSLFVVLFQCPYLLQTYHREGISLSFSAVLCLYHRKLLYYFDTDKQVGTYYLTQVGTSYCQNYRTTMIVVALNIFVHAQRVKLAHFFIIFLMRQVQGSFGTETTIPVLIYLPPEYEQLCDFKMEWFLANFFCRSQVALIPIQVFNQVRQVTTYKYVEGGKKEKKNKRMSYRQLAVSLNITLKIFDS